MAKDLKVDENGDLLIVNGDFVITDSDQQHNYDIIASSPGDWKEYPLVGFNPMKYINSRATPAELNQAAKIQLQADGCSNIKVNLSIDNNNKITGEVYGVRL